MPAAPDAAVPVTAAPGGAQRSADAPRGAGQGRVDFLGEAWDGRAAGSLGRIARTVEAPRAWKRLDPAGRRVTGLGVGVGVIDTGIAPVRGLDAPGKIVNALDLSFEAGAGVPAGLDTFGHGTHVAGIIAARDPEVRAGKEGDGDAVVGIAPDAHLVNLKVAGRDGAADVTQVIAALDWAVAHRDDPGLNLRVLNLSLGRELRQSRLLDPLAAAAEHAWRAGIVVVASAGNDGGATPLLNPAIDPYVIAVGATDDQGTEQPGDDTMAAFSNAGTPERRPDLLAPGRAVAGLRVPGSTLDAAAPVNGIPPRFLRGTGTSQAAAVVSGAAALLLQARPELTPDQVKALLVDGADRLPVAARTAGVPGALDVAGSLALRTPATVQAFAAATGTGSIELARGGEHLVDADGNVLQGEVDVFGRSWDGTSWAAASAAGTTWDTAGDVTLEGLTWRGLTWRGLTWRGLTWRGLTWRGLTWRGLTWRGLTWRGLTWR
nr:S8 family serine peptidase [Motilibacter aurantiacus]